MPITEILEKNAALYGEDTALVEINPQELEKRHNSWREYSLIEPGRSDAFRSELSWVPATFSRTSASSFPV